MQLAQGEGEALREACFPRQAMAAEAQEGRKLHLLTEAVEATAKMVPMVPQVVQGRIRLPQACNSRQVPAVAVVELAGAVEVAAVAAAVPVAEVAAAEVAGTRVVSVSAQEPEEEAEEMAGTGGPVALEAGAVQPEVAVREVERSS